MIKRSITFTNYDNEIETVDLWFHVTKPKLAVHGPEVVRRMKEFKDSIQDLDPEGNLPKEKIEMLEELFHFFLDISYGLRIDDEFEQKLPDGRPVIEKWRNQASYGEFVYQAMAKEGEVIRFILELMPPDMFNEATEQMKTQDPVSAKALEDFMSGVPVEQIANESLTEGDQNPQPEQEPEEDEMTKLRRELAEARRENGS